MTMQATRHVSPRSVCAVFVACIGLLVGNGANAHPLAPALLELREQPGGKVAVVWKTSALRVPGTNVCPILPAECRPLSRVATTETADSLTDRWTVECGEQGLVGRTIAAEDLEPAKTDVLLRLALADGRTMSFVLRGSAPSVVVPERASRRAVASDYAKLGIEHILGGPDHLLFVLGLVLLVRNIGMLVKTVTAFTLGHSVTLTLAVLGFVSYPTGLIESLIALSVFLLAVELSRSKATDSTFIRRFPWLMAGAFGLLHGLGFAGALKEAGLPAEEIPLALLAFNVGIELGQLDFVAAVAGIRAAAGSMVERLPRWTRQAPLYIMGSLAAFWFFERMGALL
jgi:hydrogenase/urease accessory protein HupE